MALVTRRLVAFANEACVISAVVDDADIDTSVVLDPSADPDPLAAARVQQITATNNTNRAFDIAVKNVSVSIPANTTRSIAIPKNRRVALIRLIGRLG